MLLQHVAIVHDEKQARLRDTRRTRISAHGGCNGPEADQAGLCSGRRESSSSAAEMKACTGHDGVVMRHDDKDGGGVRGGGCGCDGCGGRDDA